MQVISRSAGRSVVAAAAYRAGQKLDDQRQGHAVDYSRRRGVVHSEILAPAGSAAWLQDRGRLWNGVERMEGRRDAQLAREINIALPHELPAAQQLELVRTFVRAEFVSLGMVADIAIHQPVAEKGDDPRNHHAHVLLTLRGATGEGLREVKTREWNSDTLLKHWRASWAEHQNRMLRKVGHAEVDHRSLIDQRDTAIIARDTLAAIELARVPELHLGVRATAVMRKVNAQIMRAGQGSPNAEVRRRSSTTAASGVTHKFHAGGRIAANFERHAANARRWSRSIIGLQNRAARARRIYHMRQGRVTLVPAARYARSQGMLQKLIEQLEKLIRSLIMRRDARLVRRRSLEPVLRRFRHGRSRLRAVPGPVLLFPW